MIVIFKLGPLLGEVTKLVGIVDSHDESEAVRLMAEDCELDSSIEFLYKSDDSDYYVLASEAYLPTTPDDREHHYDDDDDDDDDTEEEFRDGSLEFDLDHVYATVDIGVGKLESISLEQFNADEDTFLDKSRQVWPEIGT